MTFHAAKRTVQFSLMLVLIMSTSVFAESTERLELDNPNQSWYSSPVERLGDGFANIVYGPLELVYQMKEEIKRTDPVRGLVPGLLRGVTWFGVREVVGVFEIVTFFLPMEPHLAPFDTTWLKA